MKKGSKGGTRLHDDEVGDVEIVAAATDDEHARHSAVAPQRAHLRAAADACGAERAVLSVRC